MILETQRLILHEMTKEDFGALYPILSDAEAMQHYPAPFDEEKVRRWIAVNQERYRTFGFGLWSVVLKENGEVIGDCGVTMQNIHGVIRPEIGYHIGRTWQKQGFATEAASCCRDYIFHHTPFCEVYAYMKHTNSASYRVALKCGMQLIEEYDDPVNVRTRVCAITREAWKRLNCFSSGMVSEGRPEDIDDWMSLVTRHAEEFPGLETLGLLHAHRQTVLRMMADGRALCVRDGNQIVGALLLSRKRNMICFLVVDREYRRRAIASALMDRALSMLDKEREISVITFRKGDDRGHAARALYMRYGFEPDALLMEDGYPVQRFILRHSGEVEA